MKIELPKIEPQTVKAYFNNEFIGIVNQYEFNALRIEIAKNKQEGWFVEFGGDDVYIFPNGSLSYWPEGLFDLLSNQLDQIIDFKWA